MHRIVLRCCVCIGVIISGMQGVMAQTPLPGGIPLPDELLEQDEFDRQNPIERGAPRLPQDTPLPVEPPSTEPAQILPLTDLEPSDIPTLQPSSRFPIERIDVVGNTIFETEIAKLVKPFEKLRYASFEELIALRTAITELYIRNGYITSGAFLRNNPTLNNGVVEIQVVEGALESIAINGLDRLNSGYVRSRLKLAAQAPLNQQRLERALQLLQVDPLFRRVNAELTAGRGPGLSILSVDLQETPSFNGSIGADNYQPTSIGSAQFSVEASYTNALGMGDRITAQYGRTDGLNLYDIDYSIPVNSRDGTLTLSYNTNDSRIIEDAVDELDIRSDAETFSLEFRQPLSRSVTQEFALGLGVDLRRSQTYILNDIPFSFSEGAEEGESKVTVLRFSQDWISRSRTQVIAARSQFSFGIDALDATVNDSGTDGRFIKWLGQVQYVRPIAGRSLLVTRLNSQLTPDSLLSLEKIGLGGQDTIRGYGQNQLVADNAFWGSIEARFPLSQNSDRLTLISFLDAGHAWNNGSGDPDDDFLVGLGLGLRWQALQNLTLSIDYGFPLIDVDSDSDSLQDSGIYLSLQYSLF